MNSGISKCMKPNYFVAVQVSNPKIHCAVSNVQKSLESYNKDIIPALIDVATLHITLLVIHIAEEEELHVACSALDHCSASLSHDLSTHPIHLKFHGLGNFRNQTLFAKCVEDEGFCRFLETAAKIKEIFVQMGVTVTDDRELVPHLTIAKLSKMKKGKEKRKLRKIEPSSYSSHSSEEFGIQVISGLQLLSMTKGKDSKRYYFNERASLFDVVPEESSDHSLCCFPRHQTPIIESGQRRKLHTTTVTSETSLFPSLYSFLSFSRRGNSPPFPFRRRTIATTVIGGLALLSLSFAISRWARRR